jgi:hypothetical protein
LFPLLLRHVVATRDRGLSRMPAVEALLFYL